MLYSSRAAEASSFTRTLRYNLNNGRGDIVAQADQSAALTWTASYEAYGKRTAETGTNLDKQRANSKDEDPTGLLNEGFRYRDIETGVWLSRDPAGFVDGPNVYAYVRENPWSAFDAHGLEHQPIVTVDALPHIEHTVKHAVDHVVNLIFKVAQAPSNVDAVRGNQLNHQIFGTLPESRSSEDQKRLNQAGDGAVAIVEALAGGPKSGKTSRSSSGSTAPKIENVPSAPSMPTSGESPTASQSKTSKRNQYMGRTPGKDSATGQAVIERMKQEGRIREQPNGTILVKQSDGWWEPIEKTDMSHLKDAVKAWNEGLYKTGPKSKEVRDFMKDDKNYELESSSTNRSRGGKTTERYRDPEKTEATK